MLPHGRDALSGEGRAPFALAALDGGEFGLSATGVARASVLATVTMGADVAVTSNLTLFGAVSGEAGNADRRASAGGPASGVLKTKQPGLILSDPAVLWNRATRQEQDTRSAIFALQSCSWCHCRAVWITTKIQTVSSATS